MWIAPSRLQGRTRRITLALQHFEEHVCASTRRMFFLKGHHVARTHCASVRPAAPSNTDAAQGSGGKTSFIVRKLEMRLDLGWVVLGPDAQVFVQAIRMHNFARIHLVVGVPDGLELAEGLYKFGAVHLGEQFRT